MPCAGRSLAVALFLTTAPAGLARAEDVFPLAGDPFLQALAAEALEKNPEIRAAEAFFAAATARVPQASALPDPMLDVGYQNGGRGGLAPGKDDDTFLGVTVSQAIPFPGKRRLAGAVEAKEAERAAKPVERTRRALVQRVRTAYTDLLLARENLALIDDQEEAGKAIEATTRTRYAVGLAEQSDVLRAQAELARLEQMRLHELGEERSAIAELNRLLVRPAGTPLPPGARGLGAIGDASIPVPPVEAVVARAEEESPGVAEARLAVERSRAAVGFARRNTKPDFVLSSAYLNRGSIPAMWSLDVGVVLPLYKGRKQGQAVVEAEARVREAEAALEAVRLAVRATAERSLAEFEAAVREADAYARGVLVVDRLASESALANYKAGKVPFVTVLEAHNTLYRDRWLYQELLAHVLWHSAKLDELAAND